MMRIAVIGNSHATAPQLAWYNQLEQLRPDIDVSFFRGHQIGLRAMSVEPEQRFGCFPQDGEDPELLRHAMRHNKRLSIDLSPFAAVICIGWWYFDTILLMSLLRQFEIDGIHADAGGKKMSRPAFEHILAQNIQENLPTESWHNWKVPRVLHVGMPRRNETTLEQPFNSTLDLGASAYVWKHAADLFATRLLEIGIQNIAQPKQTIGEHGLSLKQYGTGTRKQISPTDPVKPDYAHMNEAYGLLLWRDIFAALGV
ncbi:hypothetical protein [Pseudosulfitobacter sp. SM2401]|uniref:hypothetical protein n=1 Tax=Pseudosulfitobacter sp. SM2401 TaxID=3350098 RepID=UPI0036F3962B